MGLSECRYCVGGDGCAFRTVFKEEILRLEQLVEVKAGAKEQHSGEDARIREYRLRVKFSPTGAISAKRGHFDTCDWGNKTSCTEFRIQSELNPPTI